MVVNRKPTGQAVSMGKGLAIGAIFALMWTLLGAALTGKILDGEILKEADIGYASVLILLTASFGSSVISSGKIKRQHLLVCMASGCIYFVMLLCITALFFGGIYSGVGVTLVLVLAGSGAAALLKSWKRGGKAPRGYQKVRI